MAEAILVLGEVVHGAPTTVSLEVTSHLAKQARVEVVVAGTNVTGAAAGYLACGASQVHVCDDPRLEKALLGRPLAHLVKALMGSQTYLGVAIGATYTGRDAAGRLSVALSLPVLANLVGMSIEDGKVSVESTVFGATKVVVSRVANAPCGIYLVRPKSFPLGDAETANPSATVSPLPLPDGALDGATVTESTTEATTGPRLEDAPVVVSGGRGVGSAENFAMLRELASLINGSVGASRAVVDAGWVPYSMQVGQTGKTVKPAVYIACGISGAMQHTVGMKGAKNIIVINKDGDAPIFKLADLGVVGDCLTILPQLIEGIKARGAR